MAIKTWAPLRIGLELRFFAQPANDHGRAEAGARGHLGEGLVDLERQFAGGAQDQGADARRNAVGQAIQSAVKQRQVSCRFRFERWRPDRVRRAPVRWPEPGLGWV